MKIAKKRISTKVVLPLAILVVAFSLISVYAYAKHFDNDRKTSVSEQAKTVSSVTDTKPNETIQEAKSETKSEPAPVSPAPQQKAANISEDSQKAATCSSIQSSYDTKLAEENSLYEQDFSAYKNQTDETPRVTVRAMIGNGVIQMTTYLNRQEAFSQLKLVHQYNTQQLLNDYQSQKTKSGC